MKYRYYYRTMISLGAFLSVTGCSGKNPSSDNCTYTRQIGEPCDKCEMGCRTGLFCEEGICRVLCNNKDDCGSGEDCIGNRCVKTGKTEPTRNKQKGESCDAQNMCVNDLVCEGGKCLVVCQNKSDCETNEECKNSRCVPATGQITREVTMPDITSTADSATDNHGNMVQIKSSVISGSATDNNNNSIEINTGYWSK